MPLTPEQQAQVDELKDLADVGSLTDEQIWAIIEVEGSVNAAASRLWAKSAKLSAKLIDIKEGSSTRNLSNIHKQALEMSKHFGDLADEENGGVSSRASRTRAIVRPS